MVRPAGHFLVQFPEHRPLGFLPSSIKSEKSSVEKLKGPEKTCTCMRFKASIKMPCYHLSHHSKPCQGIQPHYKGFPNNYKALTPKYREITKHV